MQVSPVTMSHLPESLCSTPVLAVNKRPAEEGLGALLGFLPFDFTLGFGSIFFSQKHQIYCNFQKPSIILKGLICLNK
jgi:hypothetical protein